MTRYAIALGSNLGDRLENLRAGVAALDRLGVVDVVSSLYETAPVGGPEQDPYLNAVAVVDSLLAPDHLLSRLQSIEATLGRTRDVEWGPRTLDLDIVASDGDPVDDPSLVVPHPRAVERRFVLEPLAEVWPEAPVTVSQTAAAALEGVRDQDATKLLDGWAGEVPDTGLIWVMGQLIIFALIGLAVVFGGSLPPILGPGPGRMLGALVGVAGIVLMVWSTVSLGSNLVAVPEPVRGGELVRSGPYRWVRHPIYIAVVLVFAGVSIFFASAPAGALSALLLVYFDLKSRHEEKRLRAAYPAYRMYREEVPSRFIPGIW